MTVSSVAVFEYDEFSYEQIAVLGRHIVQDTRVVCSSTFANYSGSVSYGVTNTEHAVSTANSFLPKILL
jgi:hypothetical protein